MASNTALRVIIGLTGVNALISGATLYNSNQKLERNHEEAEARMDELEGTLRGHIGLIEDSLERLEGKQQGGGINQGMSSKADAMYQDRGRDEKKK